MAESLILPNSTFNANNITTTGNVVISTALYLGTTSIQVSVSTGGVNANVYSGGSLVRQGYAPTYAESSTAPTLAAEGDKWWSTSNSTPFRYLSGGWRKLIVSTALYTFTSATFTPGGATGQNGPTLSQARSGLTGTPTPSDWYSTYLDMTTQGVMRWTVPTTGNYRITTAGARGGNTASPFGYGANMQGNFSFTAGQVINLVVGQPGADSGTNTGGGGGTYVYVDSSTEPLIVAGGGGGGGYATGEQHGKTGTSGGQGVNGGGWGGGVAGSAGTGGGGGGGGSGGNGGTTNTGAGAGYKSNGAVTTPGSGVRSVPYGGNHLGGGNGGFGGGGGGGSEAGGGAGGYSGGGGGGWGASGADYRGSSGGGGGSYNAGTSQSNTAGAQNGDGFITITKI